MKEGEEGEGKGVGRLHQARRHLHRLRWTWLGVGWRGWIGGSEGVAGLKTKKVRAAIEGDGWWWRLTQGDLGRPRGTTKTTGHLS